MQGGAVRIDNSLFGYNSGQSGFGGALYINGSFFIYNITFINITAKVGGELFTRKLNNKVLTFHSIVFSATTQLPSVQLWKLREPATTYKSWGALLSTTAEPVRQQLLVFRDQLSSGVACINGSSISIVNSNFSHNTASGHAGVPHMEYSNLSVKGSIFDSNRAGHNSGVIYANYSSVVISVYQSSFTNNLAGEDGGVMYVGRVCSQVRVDKSTGSSTFNNAAGRGGVIAIFGGQLDIRGTNIYNNTTSLGGVVSACASDVTIQEELLVTDDPTNPLCTLYGDTDFKSTTTTSLVITSPNKSALIIYATLGISCILVLVLYIIIMCIILYLSGMFRCKTGEVNNPHIYIPINEDSNAPPK